MNDYREFSDVELCRLLTEGNHAAFNEIHKRYYSLLYRHAYKRLPHREEVKDILQELFAFIWNNRNTLVLSSGLASYLYVATRNRVINVFNRQKIRDEYADSLQGFLDQGENITDWAIRVKELTILVEKEVASLPPQMRKVFELSRNAHMTYQEIGEMLNTSPLTVKKQIHNTLKILREKLGANVFFLFF
ncbi:RNA polymerase sigma-70 factor, ECF subfamily [Pedobacter steynii]|uniref:RNA polymerase sigma-70 factor, ECF subfamily n=1 Tax=Pedobacter steynii TaxID=430522 RepID=A0A1H0CLF7_9SPHI|nr:RNA polymerase sigma-70 factor [Pedobacter steynii]NQX41601.1 RNA polymerase sigma-70 factor [Pedobacter steynii]SDN58685.1 RNA polymerase sigma-70 factor, ECF subfamily [Pedobacter steynii]